MVLNVSSDVNGCKNHSAVIKLRAGASIVKEKSLFSWDSRFIIVPSGYHVKVFSIVSGECTLTFKEHKQPVISVQICKKNNLQVLSCSEDSVVIRWDYLDGKSLMKYELGMNTPVTSFFAPTVSKWFVTSQFHAGHRVYAFEIKSSTENNKEMLLKLVQPCDNSVAFGPECSYVAGIHDNALVVRELATKIFKRHLTGERKLLCVASHPTEYMIATGDNLGCILVWTNFIHTNRPTRSIYHWHSLPLADLVFSVEGSHIYSGGGESVLVKWNLNSGTKQTLPRLGLPICRLAVSPDNVYIATSHTDNGIHIINKQDKVVQIIQGLTQGHCSDGKRRETLPTGMLYDPRSAAVIMNGKPGHLQFYDIHEDRQLFNLDIVGQNYVSQERDSVVFNTDIELAAIDCKGLWLATVECRDDGETSPEIRLKFWNFEIKSQKFVLNTNIFLPHHKKINCLKFRPEFVAEELKEEYSPLAVTTSNDGRFKIWILSEADKNGGKKSWSCELMGYYKELPARDGSFSEDGSLLAVAFGHIVTLWSPDINVLKTALCKSDTTGPIKSLIFGRGKCCHLLVCCYSTKLTVWNVLTLSAMWSLSCEVQYLIDNPSSEVMALFSNDNNLYIFKPCDPKPIMVLNNVSSAPVIAAVFVPYSCSSSQLDNNSACCCWQQHTKLYFLNQNQEVLTVTDASDEPLEKEFEKLELQQNVPLTPFGLLQAEHTVSGVKPIKLKKHILYEFGKEENIEVNELPCPSNVNPITLCSSLLPSLLNPREQVKVVKHTSNRKEQRTDSESSDSEPETKVFEKSAKKSEPTAKADDLMDTHELFIPQLEDFKYLIDYVNF